MNTNSMYTNSSENHPIIKSENTYLYIKKYISIHSEDRNIEKYPNASNFEIELPQEYSNVSAARISSWDFPIVKNVFSEENNNLSLTFQFISIYSPPIGASAIEMAAYQGLNSAALTQTEFIVQIEPGTYTPEQLEVELTNKFNKSVTDILIDYFAKNNHNFTYTGYTQFVVKYNTISKKMWFGNKSSQFIITNESPYYTENMRNTTSCMNRGELPDYSSWGLPVNLGFERTDILSTNTDSVFYYTNINDGKWLIPDLPEATTYSLSSTNRINIDGSKYFYVEIPDFNCIDEISPYNKSEFTDTYNKNNSIVNAAFAKIPIMSEPIYYNAELPYKWFYPPNERIRKLRIKIRYHDGQLVSFEHNKFSFVIELTIMSPQQNRQISVIPKVF